MEFTCALRHTHTDSGPHRNPCVRMHARMQVRAHAPALAVVLHHPVCWMRSAPSGVHRCEGRLRGSTPLRRADPPPARTAACMHACAHALAEVSGCERGETCMHAPPGLREAGAAHGSSCMGCRHACVCVCVCGCAHAHTKTAARAAAAGGGWDKNRQASPCLHACMLVQVEALRERAHSRVLLRTHA